MNTYTKTPLNKVIRGNNRATYDQAQVYKILDQHFMGFIAYAYDGTAITLPMAYARIDDKIYIHGSLKNRMLLALLASQKMSITVMSLDGLVLARSAFHHSVNYHSVTLFGGVKKIEDITLKTEALQQIIEQMIPNRWDHLRPMTKKELNATLVVEMTIETASVKIRAEGAVDDKEDIDLPIWAGVIPIHQTALKAVTNTNVSKHISIPKHVNDFIQQNN